MYNRLFFHLFFWPLFIFHTLYFLMWHEWNPAYDRFMISAILLFLLTKNSTKE